MIGKFEQPVYYEGVQKICFSFGRMGHKKASCLYTIRPMSRPKEMSKMALENCREVMDSSCDKHVFEEPTMETGRAKNVHGSEPEEGQERTYGPWIVVEHRMNVKKNQRSGGSHAMMDNGKLRQEQRKAESEVRFNFIAGKQHLVDGLSRETKRTLSPPKQLNQAQLASSRRSIRPSDFQQAHKSTTRSPEALKWTDDQSQADLEVCPNKPNQNAFVKGKKAIARSRAPQGWSSSVIKKDLFQFSSQKPEEAKNVQTTVSNPEL